ncbi:23S ribosomal RNA methyltransferase Erm [Streptomyces sp. B15]|uniref:23S ribosomal RNA methyltransferase Erm n=1 Tax=Streptomyces sp. B15 TaxID=1537797 RepID=UPI001B382ADD|nr:23S ribosomal RNA methyltransferase Erm [Streptomyces sp. B15]MBQ1122711.1 23S ribosomal RNA methyltransferase Erm [Streptomyces sp. B15]
MPRHSTRHHEGRHELGQNFLTDPATIGTFVTAVAETAGPVVEIGGGDGALTLPLQRLGRPLTVLETDARTADRLRRRTAASTTVLHADFLRWKAPRAPHVLVGNLPFHRTTAMLRRILHASEWTDAVLLVQWEVARRRAGVGGATMMTAQWWPWYDFRLIQRVPAAAFRPRPGVDGGLMTLTRRAEPLLDSHERHRYQDFVHRVFTGPGRGLAEILPAAVRGSGGGHGGGHGGGPSRGRIHGWLRGHGVRPDALPKSLTATQWAELYHLTARTARTAHTANGRQAGGTRVRRRTTVSGE